MTTQTPGPAAAAPESPLAGSGSDSGSGSTHPSPSRPKPTPRPKAELPRLGEVIRDAERLAQQALAVLARDVDPASVPGDNDAFGAPGYVHSRLLCAKADIRSALKMLGDITDERLPAVGSAVMTHPVRTTGEGRTPGLAGSVATTSELRESPAGSPTGRAGASHDPDPTPPRPRPMPLPPPVAPGCPCLGCRPRVSG